MFKTRLDTFEDDFGQFGILKIFWVFLKFFKTRPSMEHGAIFFSKKNATKHVQNKFGHFWKRVWAFLGFWIFFENLPRLDPPWNIEQIFLSKKMPQNTFGHLGTILDNFRTLNFFSLFPWKFSKSLPQNLSPENRTHFFKSWKLISYF